MYEVWLLKIDKWSLDIDNYYYLACYPNRRGLYIFRRKVVHIKYIYMLRRYTEINEDTLINSKVY